MDYYIQGNAAKADKIKAAFEKLNTHSISGYDFSRGDVLFFSFTGKKGVKYMMSTNMDSWLADMITTHPDYKEQELSIESKFKAGDWLYHNTCGVRPILVMGYDERKGYQVECVKTKYELQRVIVEKEYHLWTIADAKDGDVIVLNGSSKEYKWIGIFKAHTSDTSFSSHCHYNCGMCEFVTHIARCTKHGTKYNDIRPATNEERDLLFAKMREAGYEWDADKKELRKIKPHYDIANFKPFDKVLVRDGDMEYWTADFFSSYHDEFHCFRGSWEQCIPFNDDTKHLLGTTDMPNEMYINW